MDIIIKAKEQKKIIQILSKIKNEDDYNSFFKDKQTKDIPFVKLKNNYFNLTFLSVLANNSFLLDKLLKNFHNSFSSSIIVKERKIQIKNQNEEQEKIEKTVKNLLGNKYTPEILEELTGIKEEPIFEGEIQDFIDLNTVFLNHQISENNSELFLNNIQNTKILNVLYEHNLIEKSLIPLSEKLKKHNLTLNLSNYYLNNNIIFNNKDLYYSYFNAKNYIETFDQTTYEQEKKLYTKIFNRNEQQFLEDRKIFYPIVKNINNIDIFFRDILTYLNKNRDTHLNYWNNINQKFMFINKNSSFSNIIGYIFEKNVCLELFKYVHQKIDLADVPIKKKPEPYTIAFANTTDYFIPFYEELKNNFDFSLSPELVNPKNKKNLFYIIENNKNQVGKKLYDIILSECKNSNYNFYYELINKKNINKKEISNSFIKAAIYINKKSDQEDISKLIQYMIKNKDELGFELKLETRLNNQTRIFIEKEILFHNVHFLQEPSFSKKKRL